MQRLAFLLFLSCQFVVSANSPVIGAYYENWSQYRPGVGGRPQFMPNMIDPTIITDLYYAFAIFGFIDKSIDPNNPHLTGDYLVQPVEWNDQSLLYPEVQALKKSNPSLRTLLSIGGWSFNDPNDPNGMGQYTYRLFSEMVASKLNRTEFIDSAISYAHQYGFDGIDIDWEYPGDLTRGGTNADFANFITFLEECYTACKATTPALLLTYASAAIVPSGVPESYHEDPDTYFQWLGECAPYLDRFNIMAYDYHGPFDNPQLTGVNAPLMRDTNPDSTYYVAKTIENYLKGGVPASKMVLGMPTYGHSYGGVANLSPSDNGPGHPFTTAGKPGPATLTPGFLAYFEIADINALGELTFAPESVTATALGWNSSTQEWASYDTPDTIALKAQVSQSNNLQGIMFWAVDDDEYYWQPTFPNIRRGYTQYYNSSAVYCD